MKNDVTNAERIPLIIFGSFAGVLLFVGEYGFAIIMIIIGTIITVSVSKSKKKSSSNLNTSTFIETSTNNESSINKEITREITITKEDFENNLQRFEWRDMELITEALFKQKGYDAEVTQTTADNGIDVEAKNDTEYIGIQVKHWENNVGYDDVAKTLGSSSKFNKFIIISTRSGFTSQAWKRAEDDPYRIELWDSKRFKEELQKNFLK